MRVAVLSNVNMNAVIRLLGKSVEIYQTEGYGNELGILMNPDSGYHDFSPEYTFLLMDLMELLEHELETDKAKERIEEWFAALSGILPKQGVYYISDTYLCGVELAVLQDTGRKAALENLWQKKLEDLAEARSNVRIFPLRKMVEELGENNAFSGKMWYMGKIPLTNEAQRVLCGMILEKLRVEEAAPKKVLVLDLDNTLWGGLAGENDHSPIELSEEHRGLAYKNLQRVILQMQRQGVLLAVISKNNETDALAILETHPHMILRKELFAAIRINWKPKHVNMLEIADELNLGTDSFVFWDDSPEERQLVKELLPQVEVPDFPDRPEDLAPAMAGVYWKYFARPVVTEEDLHKTAQYAANAARRRLQDSVDNFEDYLKNLCIEAVREEPRQHIDRFVQLVNKTNQFNLTTKRYTRREVDELVQNEKKRVYLYSVRDRFGDQGIAAVLIVDCEREVPQVEEFAMSCRVMGKNIEYALLEDVEHELKDAGYTRLRGSYFPTAKNQPVECLYSRAGYDKLRDLPQGGAEFEISLEKTPVRMYHVKCEKK